MNFLLNSLNLIAMTYRFGFPTKKIIFKVWYKERNIEAFKSNRIIKIKKITLKLTKT